LINLFLSAYSTSLIENNQVFNGQKQTTGLVASELLTGWSLISINKKHDIGDCCECAVARRGLACLPEQAASGPISPNRLHF
jgi:hypothetical protein